MSSSGSNALLHFGVYFTSCFSGPEFRLRSMENQIIIGTQTLVFRTIDSSVNADLPVDIHPRRSVLSIGNIIRQYKLLLFLFRDIFE